MWNLLFPHLLAILVKLNILWKSDFCLQCSVLLLLKLDISMTMSEDESFPYTVSQLSFPLWLPYSSLKHCVGINDFLLLICGSTLYILDTNPI